MAEGCTGRMAALAVLLVVLLPAGTMAQDADDETLSSIGREAFEVLRDFFVYDPAIPLDARIVDRVEGETSIREKVAFDGPRDSRVPAYLATPSGSAPPYPCVLLLHGIGDSKEAWFEPDSFPSGGVLTERLLASGFAVLALDAEYHGERAAKNDYESPIVFTLERNWIQRARDMIVHSAVESRRAIDYLETRDDIDTGRTGIIGYSMGGLMTFQLAAVEPRIRAAVAAVTPILKEEHSALAAHNFAPYVGENSFLMLMGSEDSRNYSEKDARRLHALLGSSVKELSFYESGHRLPVDWTRDAVEWMERHLQSVTSGDEGVDADRGSMSP